MDGNSIIVKRNDLVSRSAYRLDNLEQLIFIAALSKVDSRSKVTDEDIYYINIKNLSDAANMEYKGNYRALKQAASKLRKREISIPLDNGEVLVTGFIQSYKYHDNEGKISIRFTKDILPYISLIKDSFVAYKFKQVAKFKSNYSVRLYELLIQKLDLSNIKIITLDEIRSLFKLGKSYDLYSNIKLKVITPAIRDINDFSDINVIYKEVRKGKKVTALEFHIEALEPRPATKKQIEQEALPGESYNETKERLKEEEKEPKKTLFWKKLFN